MGEKTRYVYSLRDHFSYTQDVFKKFEDADAEALKNIKKFNELETVEKKIVVSRSIVKYFVSIENKLSLKQIVEKKELK